jgi:hypothetical protein
LIQQAWLIARDRLKMLETVPNAVETSTKGDTP